MVFQKKLHFFTLFLTISTVFLLAAGALVTSTGSGLAVPDWPLSYGQFFPPMIGGILFEHGHRLVAGFVAILSLTQAILYGVFETRTVHRRVAYTALFVVILQALLGGLTVLLKLPPQVSVMHACLAQIFFCLVVSLSLMSSKLWIQSVRDLDTSRESAALPLPLLCTLITGFFFVQLLFGATMRHTGAGLAIPDFPTVFGSYVPPVWDSKILIHYLHRSMAFVLVFLVSYQAIRINKNYSSYLELGALSGGVVALVFFQFILGAMTIWLKKPVFITMSHLVTGALCLATNVALTLQVLRRWKREPNSSKLGLNLGMEPA